MQDTAQNHSSMDSSVSGFSARNAEISLLMPIFRGRKPPPSARRLAVVTVMVRQPFHLSERVFQNINIK